MRCGRPGGRGHRTGQSRTNFGQGRGKLPGLRLTEPLGYLDFLKLMTHARMVLTDSGGIQEETTYLKVPCLTLRNNTERPVTVTLGTNILVGQSGATLRTELDKVLTGKQKASSIPPLWDGHAGERIAEILNKL